MNRTWKLLGLPVLLAVLTVAPVRADEPLDKAPLTVENKLDLLLQRIGAMQQKMDRQQIESEYRDEQLELRLRAMKNRLADLEQRLDRMEKDRVSNYSPNGAALTLDRERELLNRIAQLEQKLDQVNKRSAFYPSDTVNPPPLPPMATGAVRVQNRSLAQSTVVVNGVSYTVLPLQSVTIPNLPAGATFTYEVLQDARGFAHPLQARTVPANDTHVIYINP
jgi:hypothetical protein